MENVGKDVINMQDYILYYQHDTISILAFAASFSAVNAPSSSMSAGKNVPLPFALGAANSDATVNAKTL